MNSKYISAIDMFADGITLDKPFARPGDKLYFDSMLVSHDMEAPLMFSNLKLSGKYDIA